jgi:hypothetical protein
MELLSAVVLAMFRYAAMRCHCIALHGETEARMDGYRPIDAQK